VADGPFPLPLAANIPLGLESNPINLSPENRWDERFAWLAPDFLRDASVQTAKLSEFFSGGLTTLRLFHSTGFEIPVSAA
jgi:hypothetical protein